MSQEKEEVINPKIIEEERDIGGSEVNQQEVEGIEVVIDPVREEPGVQEEEESDNDDDNMTTSSESSNPFRIMPTFDGKKEKFQRFMLKFRAYASEKNFKYALKESEYMPEDPEAEELTEDQKKWVKANEKAVSAYTMALIGEEVFEVICNSITEAYPDGLAYMITEELTNEYQPSDGTTSLEYLNSLNKVKLGKNENPANVFNKVAAIKMAYSTTKDRVQERDLVMTIIRVAPDQYSEAIENLMQQKGDELTVKDLKEAMNRKFRFMVARGKVTEEDKDGHETVLSVTEKFNGNCYKCGKTGHKANDPVCPLYHNGAFKGRCNKCGMRGHKEKDCWENESNKDKRPTGWKSKLRENEEKDERNNFVRDNNEYLLL